MKTVTVNLDPKMFFYLGGIVVSLILVWILKTVIVIFFIAFIISAGLKPLVNKLESKKVPRAMSIIIIYLLFLFLVILVLTIVASDFIKQFANLIESLPQILLNFLSILEQKVPVASKVMPLGQMKNDVQYLLDNSSEEKILSRLVSGQNPWDVFYQAYGAAGTFFGVFFKFLATIFVSAYLIIRGDKFYDQIFMYFPKRVSNRLMKLIQRIENGLGAWIVGQLTLMVISGIILYTVLIIPGFFFPNYHLDEYALPLAILSGMLEIIPNLGILILMVVASILALGTTGFSTAVYIVVTIQLIQSFSNAFIVPTVIRKAVGLDPIVSILAILGSYEIAGMVGAVLVIPVLTILKIVIEETIQYWERNNGKTSKEQVSLI